MMLGLYLSCGLQDLLEMLVNRKMLHASSPHYLILQVDPCPLVVEQIVEEGMNHLYPVPVDLPVVRK
jgi:hypothetical protein